MEEFDFDLIVEHWLEDYPYVWVPNKNVWDCKRLYIFGVLEDELTFFIIGKEDIVVENSWGFGRFERDNYHNIIPPSKGRDMFVFPMDCEAKNYFGVYRWGNYGTIKDILAGCPYPNGEVRMMGKKLKTLPLPNTNLWSDYDKHGTMYASPFTKKEVRIVSYTKDGLDGETYYLHDATFSFGYNQTDCRNVVSDKIKTYPSLLEMPKSENLLKNYSSSDCNQAKLSIVDNMRKNNRTYEKDGGTITSCNIFFDQKFSSDEYASSLFFQVSKIYFTNPTTKEDIFRAYKNPDTYASKKEFNNILYKLKKKNYDEQRGEKKAQEVLEMLPKDKLTKDSVVVDFGAGDGAIIESLSRLVGLDKKNAIALDLKEPPQSRYYSIETNIRNIKTASVDCVILFEVLHHVEIGLVEIVRELKRILKNDGFIVIKEHDIPNNMYKMNDNEERQQVTKFYNDYERYMVLIHEMWYSFKSEKREGFYPLKISDHFGFPQKETTRLEKHHSVTGRALCDLFFPLSCYETKYWEKNNYQRIFRASFSRNCDVGRPPVFEKEPRKPFPYDKKPFPNKTLPLSKPSAKVSYKKIDGKLVKVIE